MGCARSARVVHVYKVVAGGPLRLCGVSLVVAAMGDEDLWGPSAHEAVPRTYGPWPRGL